MTTVQDFIILDILPALDGQKKGCSIPHVSQESGGVS